MAVPRWVGWLAAGGVAAVGLAAALTVYTFPSDAAGSRAIRMTIQEALGRPGPHVPPPAALTALAVGGELRPTGGPVGERRPSAFEPSVDPAARAWARDAAAADAAALRAWISGPRVTTRSVRNDSLYVTSRRLTTHAGCPFVSTLRAVFRRLPDRTLHLVRLSADCPAVPERRSPLP